MRHYANEGFDDDIDPREGIAALGRQEDELIRAIDDLRAELDRVKDERARLETQLRVMERSLDSSLARQRGLHFYAADSTLGNLLSRLRDEAEVTNEDLGDAAGITASTVGQILAGEISCPPIERLEGFADVLGVPVERLVAAAESDGCDYSPEEE